MAWIRLPFSSTHDDDDTQEEAQLRRDKLAGVCFAAVGFGQKRGVISIYGGYLQAVLKSQTDKSFSVLSKNRAVRRLNRVGVKSSEKTDADPHPHATAITEVLSFTCTVLDNHLLGKGLGSDVELAIAEQLHDDCCNKATQVSVNSLCYFIIQPTFIFCSVLHTAPNPFCYYNLLCFSQMQILSWMHEDCGVDWWCDQAKNAGRGSNKQDSAALHGEPSTFDTQERMTSPSLSFCFVCAYIMTRLHPTPPLLSWAFFFILLLTQDLDFVVDELSFVCQVVKRYIEFVEARDCLSMNSEASQGLFQSYHHSVGSYVGLEDSYCLLSVKEAVKIAEPIEVSKRILLLFFFRVCVCVLRAKQNY